MLCGKSLSCYDVHGYVAVQYSAVSCDKQLIVVLESCVLQHTTFFSILQAGIEGCIFIHASGFIGGHATKEGAIAMAIKVRCVL